MAAPKLISRRYEVLELLGQGGMGTVYKVRHTALGSISALKVLPPQLMQDPEMVTRFYREARIMANLSHPSIVRVLDIDHDDTLDFHYFVMEYVEGQTLKQYVEKKSSLTLSETLDVVGQVARALAYAHGHAPPIIHRDIKPSNIMIEDRSGRVVVMDFGIAKELDGKDLTRPGVTIGTLKYCAPEQMRQEQLDGAVDVYALGMVTYETYTGAHLFAGLRERELVARVLVEKNENAPVFEKPTPQAFADLVARAIAKSREVRFPSMAAFLRELEVCMADSEVAPARTGTTGRFRPRLVASRGDTPPRVTELEPEWRDEAATKPKPPGPTPQLEQQVQEVRDRTGVLRDVTSSVKGRHRDRAERGWRRAERLLEEGKLADAKTSFEEAASLFSALTSRVADDSSASGPAVAAPRHEIRPEEQTVVSAIREQPSVALEPAPPPPTSIAPVEQPAALVQPEERAEMAAPAQTLLGMPATAGPGPGAPIAPPAATITPGRSWLLPALLAAGVAVAGGIGLYLRSGDDRTTAAPSAAQAPAAPVVSGQGGDVAPAAPASVAEMVEPAATGDAPAPQGGAVAAAGDGTAAQPAGSDFEPVAPLAVVPPQPSAVPEAVAAAADVVAAPEAEPAPSDEESAALTPDDATRLSDVTRIVRFTRNPTVDIETPAPANTTATLDDRPLKMDRTGRVRGSLTGLPVGVSEHALRLTDPTSGASQDIPVVVTYYPAWEMRRFGELNGEAYAVAFSPDGTRVLAGTRSNVVKMWDATTGALVRAFTGHKDWVNDVAISPDGTTIVSGSKDRTLKLWDVESGSELRTLTGHKGWVNGVAFSPDGARVASVSDDQTVKLWDVASGEQLASLPGHKDWILAVAFSADGKTVASGGRDKVVKLWDADSGELRQTLAGHTDWVNAVAFSPDGRLVASASDDRRIKLWDVATGKAVKTLSGHGGWVVGLAFSPDGSKLISASKDQTVRMWDVASGQELRTFSGHKGLVGDVAFAPDGKSAVSGGRDRTLRLWWTASEPSKEAREVVKGRDSG